MSPIHRQSTLFLIFVLIIAALTACGKKEEPKQVEADKVVQPGAAGLAPRDMKIGILGPETGELAEYGRRTLIAAQIAVDEINSRGGIGGKKLELVHMDNKNDSETTKDAMGELIRQKVVAVVANPTGWSTFGPIALANEYHTILISAGTRRKTGHSGGYVFRNTAPDEIAIAEVLSHASTKLGYKDFALITAMDDDYSITLSGLFKKEVLEKGGRVVVENFAMTGVAEVESQYADIVKEIKAKGGVQAIIYTGGGGAGKLLKEARKAGIKAPLIGGEELYVGNFLTEAGDAALDSVAYTGYLPTAGAAGFIKEYKAKAKADPDAMAALSYDAVMMVAKAIETAGSTAPDKVRDALAGLKECVGVTGICSFDGSGEPVKKPFIVRAVKQGSAVVFAPVQ